MWTFVTLLGGWLIKQFSFETLKYLAMRAFLIALCLGVGPIVIFKGYSYIMEFFLNYVSSYISGVGMEGVSLNVVGFGGWLASELRVGEAISIILGFCLLSFSLRMIRAK